jgi:phosphatidylserine decarboxylase precursor-related protein
MSAFTRLHRHFLSFPASALPVLLVATLATILLGALWTVFGVIGLCIVVLMLWAYADPPRQIPYHHGLAVSAADGEITAIADGQGLPLILERAKDQAEHYMKITVQQGLLSSRQLRAPVSGQVIEIRHDATAEPEPAAPNDSLDPWRHGDCATLLIRDEKGQETAIVIRGLLIPRQIWLNIEAGANVSAGDRLGLVLGLAAIDHYIIGTATRLITTTNHVHAGETVLTGSYANAIHRSFREI